MGWVLCSLFCSLTLSLDVLYSLQFLHVCLLWRFLQTSSFPQFSEYHRLLVFLPRIRFVQRQTSLHPLGNSFFCDLHASLKSWSSEVCKLSMHLSSISITFEKTHLASVSFIFYASCKKNPNRSNRLPKSSFCEYKYAPLSYDIIYSSLKHNSDTM